jgi:hypothetical protein
MADRIELHRLESHPLAWRFHNLAMELDALPADERQSALLIKLQELRRDTQALLDDEAYRAKVGPGPFVR